MHFILWAKTMRTDNEVVLLRARAILAELEDAPPADNPVAQRWNDAFRKGIQEQERLLTELVEDEHKRGLGGPLP